MRMSLDRTRPLRSFARLVPILLFAFFSAGCGSKTAPVSGKVTFRGALLKDGRVTFISENGKPRSGRIEKDGTYLVEDALLGPNRVVVDPMPQEMAHAEVKEKEGQQMLMG